MQNWYKIAELVNQKTYVVDGELKQWTSIKRPRFIQPYHQLKTINQLFLVIYHGTIAFSKNFRLQICRRVS